MKMNTMCQWRLLVMFLFILVPTLASAANYFTRNGGSWTSGSRWSTVGCNGANAGVSPGIGDSATICNGHAINLDTSIGGAGLTFLTVNNGGVLNMASNNTARTLTVAGNVTNAGTLQQPTGRNTTSILNVGGDIINTGTFDFRTDADSLVNTVFTGGGTHTISGSGAMRFNNTTVNNNLIINKTAGVITHTGTFTANGDLTITQGTINFDNSVSVSGTTNISGTLGITNTAGTASFTGAVIINNSGDWNVTVAENVTMENSLTNNGTFTSGAGTYTFQTTAGSVWDGANGLTFSGAVVVDANRTNNTTTTVTGNLTGTATLTNAAGQRLRLGGTSTITGLTAAAANNTVEYFGTVAQTVKTIDYQNLEVNKSTNPATTTTGTININGTLTVTAGTLNLDATTVTLAATGSASISGTLGITSTTGAKTFNGNITVNNGGVWNHTVNSGVSINANLTNNGTFTANTGAAAIYTFGGSSAQSITGTAAGTTTIARVTLNNANGLSLTGSHNLEVSNTLTLTSGRITTNANYVFVLSGNAVSGAGATTFVVGNLRKAFATGNTTRVFETGTVAGGIRYAPVSITLANVTGAGNLTVSSTAGDHPNIATSSLDATKSINRYWTVTNNSVTFTANAGNSLGFTFVNPDDYDGGANSSLFFFNRYNAPDWTEITPTTRTATTTVTTGTAITTGTISGDYQIAQLNATPPAVTAYYKMDEMLWNGTANEVLDSGSNNYHGQAATLSAPVPTTDNTSPALAGSPGTCRYGVFDRSKKDYVALPAGLPNLTAAGATGFSATAWIKTTNNLLSGQRIIIDDQGATGGWGFSVGETTVAGGVRFYYRAASTVIIDTVPIASNQWLFVALSVKLATGANASNATIYVYNTAGSLVTSQTGTFTWAGEVDAGPMSIGGETNASGENTNFFGFSGNIDEVRVYASRLNSAQIVTVMNDTHNCFTSPDHIRIEHDGLGLSCAPETVTVKACADSTCSTLYTDTSVTTTLSPTGWVGGDSVSFTGSTTKSLRRTTPGSISLGAGSTTPTPINATRCFIGGTETCSMEFKDSGFIFDIPTQTANKTSSTVKVKAVRTDLTSQTCAPAFSGARSVGFWSTYTNPATGTQQVEVNGSSVSTTGPSGTLVNLTFDASAEADITVKYPDAGQMQLNARYSGSGSEAGLVMDGNDQFVVVPAGLCVQTASSCVAGDHTCSVFAAAGSPFALTVKAAAWEVDGETDAQFCNNSVTPNFRLNDIVLSTQLIAPAGGVNATLATTDVDIIAANNGSNTNSNQTVSEVGVFRVTATPPAYLGETIAASTSANIGRFTPYDFGVSVTTAPVFASSCNAFTYIGQPFDLLTAGQFTVTARAQGGGTTQNYTGNFNRITSGTIVFPGGTDMGFREGSALGLDTGLLGSWAPVIADAGGGLTTLTFDFGVGERISFNRGTPVAPFDAEISLEVDVADTDGIVYGDGAGNEINPAKFGDTGAGQGIAFNSDKEQRWGRMTLANAFGSELLPLKLDLQTEYYLNASSGFVPNTADSCTVYQGSDVAIQDANLSDTLVPADVAVLVPATPTSMTGGVFNPASPLLLSNPGNTNLGPGAGKTGALQLTMDLSALTGSAQDWLQYDWADVDNLGNGPWDGNPFARASFGLFRGSEDFIYIREPWN